MIDTTALEDSILASQQNIDAEKQRLTQGAQKKPDWGAAVAGLADMMGSGGNENLQRYKLLAEMGQQDPVKKQALQQQLMQQEQGLISKRLQLAKLTQKGAQELSLTPGQKKLDETFATGAADWEAAGGFANFAGNLDRLKQASAALGEKGDLANTVKPKWFRDMFDPESSKLQEDVEFVAQQSLKQILGGQFSEKEGENLIRRTYNPRLPDEVNQRKLDTLIKQLGAQAEAKQKALDYFSEHGTLKGFKGTSATTLSGFEKELKDKIMGGGEDKLQDPKFLEWKKQRGH